MAYHARTRSHRGPRGMGAMAEPTGLRSGPARAVRVAASPASGTPAISVVIPTYRRPQHLRELLAALADSAMSSARFEVIVVDDAGGVPLEPVVDDFRDTLQLTLLRQPRNTGPAGARNAGARRARGEILAFVDDDCRPDPDWLPALEGALAADGGARLCGGHVVNALEANPFSATSQFVLDLVYEQVNREPRRAEFLTTNNLVVSADAFRALGGFDARFRTAEDREFCDRWRASGRELRYVPAAVVHHAHDLGFWSFCRQHFAYGRGARDFHRGRGAGSMRGSLNFHRDPRKWLAQPFRRGVARPLATAALLVVWQAANAIGFGWQIVFGRWRQRRRDG